MGTPEALDENWPLGSYLALIGVYSLTFVAGYIHIQRRAQGRLRPPAWRDLALLIPASFKLSRIITKDWVTRPIRAPFTRIESLQSAGEVKETSVGHGMQAAVGDLLSCNYCFGLWSSGALVYGMYARPGMTRLAATVLTVAAGADFIHLAYETAK